MLYVLLTDSATDRSAITVTAEADGHVTLAGTVSCYAERSMAVLHWDAYINDSGIQVSARRGVVTLTGDLQSLAEKHRVVELSWAAGAHRVAADGLRVSGGTDRVHAGVPANRGGDDDAIVGASRRVLKLDPRLADVSVDIRADHGVVTLEGSLPSLATKRAALWLVYGVRGVQSVNDLLRVPEEARLFSDEEARLRIERALMRNSLTREDPIAVSVADGSVTLEGDAYSWLSRRFAEGAAASVMGIATICNEIAIATGGERATGQMQASIGVWWTPGMGVTPALTNALATLQHP